MHSGPKTKRDGLVFGFDTGQFGSSTLNSGKYSLEKTTRRFNKGKSTTNVVTNTNLNTGWSKGYQTSIVFDEIRPPKGVNSPTVGFNKSSSSSYWYSYGNYAPQSPSTTYTISMYVKTRDSNFRIRAYTADNSETGRQWTELITVPDDGKWHRVVWDSITTPSNTQSDSLSFNFYMADTGDSSRTWFCAPQMEASGHATPFVAGTRSEVGLRDLTKKTSINTSSVSYDGNGFMTFDGTDDHISLPTSLVNNLSTSELTVEAIVYHTSWGTSSGSRPYVANWNSWQPSPVNQRGFILRTYTTAQYPSFWYCWGSGYSAVHASSATFNLNQYHHVVGVFKKNSYAKIYVDGKEAGSTTTGTGNNLVYDDSIGTRIGYGTINTGRMVGNLPVIKLYNKALSASEVKQNFSACRKRFNM